MLRHKLHFISHFNLILKCLPFVCLFLFPKNINVSRGPVNVLKTSKSAVFSFGGLPGARMRAFLERKHEWPSRNTRLPAPTRTVRGSLSIIQQPSYKAMLKVATNSPTECELRLVAKRKNKRKSDAFQTCFENEQKCSFFFWWVAGGSNPGPFD